MDSCSNSTALNSRKHFGPSQAGLGELSGQGRRQGSLRHKAVSCIRNKTDKAHLPQTWGALAQGPLSPPAQASVSQEVSWASEGWQHSHPQTYPLQAVLTEGALRGSPSSLGESYCLLLCTTVPSFCILFGRGLWGLPMWYPCLAPRSRQIY